MTEPTVQKDADSRSDSLWAFWAVIAAFGTYFCMYGFRKPFTAASFSDASVGQIDFKTVVVSTQVMGYMLSKFIGIKVISEMPRQRRATAILVLIAVAELGLVCFGSIPRPWNVCGLFLNGLSLGMVFGLVLSFLEGRRLTEALTAGLCASFILADGVTKSLGAWLLDQEIPEDWMPCIAGLIFLLPLCVCVAMLARIPSPTALDVDARSVRSTLNRAERWALLKRHAGGLTLLVLMYLLVTVIRSVRADFQPELWDGLGEKAAPAIFTKSEMFVAIGVLVINGGAVRVRDNRKAFFVSLATCCFGFAVLAAALVGLQASAIDGFQFMVLVGLGLYLPYVAIHTTVFERLIAMTRERGNIAFLMYVADAFGYLGYIAVMISRKLFTETDDFLTFFTRLCWFTIAFSLVSLLFVWRYFAVRIPNASSELPPSKGIS